MTKIVVVNNLITRRISRVVDNLYENIELNIVSVIGMIRIVIQENLGHEATV